MDNILNYVDNYGNYSFKEKNFNDIDNLIFSSLVYLDYSNFLIKKNKYTLEEIGKYYLKDKNKLNKNELLLGKVITKERYKNIILSDYIYKRNENMQFGAMTFKISNKLMYISFEGTDKHISSFKEDAYLACMYPVPSHIEAINYVNKHVSLFGPNVIIGGHSKGGNLALISGMYMKKYKKFKVLKIYSNDGPGLRKKEFESKEYKKIKNKYIHFVPSESIVGMLLRSDKYYVVKTNKKGIKAHSMINWYISNNNLIEDKLSNSSIKLSNNLIAWLDNHNDEERKHIVDEIFKLFDSKSDEIKFSDVLNIVLKIKNIDKDTKYLIKELLMSINNKGEENEKNNRS